MYGKVVNGKIVYAPDNYKRPDGTLIIGFNTNEELMQQYGYKEIVEHEVDYDPNTEELYISNIKETINLIEVYYSSRNKNTFVNVDLSNVYTRDETYDRATIDGFINHLQIDKADISDLNTINAKITNLEAGRVDTEYLDANYATIEQLNATNANVSNLQADKANITDLHATNAEIENLKVDKADIAALTATNAKITNLEADKADISFLEANYATINQLDATNANITNLQADTANINNAIINKADIIDLNATNANIANLQAIKANITDLDAAKADINVLNSNVADIDTLINGNLTSDNIQSMIITGDKFTVADAFIKDAMIANVSASKINTGIINTNNVRIQSDDGSMVINGTTQQFKDKDNKVRIQIGKDAQGNFTFALFSQDGVGILIDETGIKSGAVPDGLIVNDMVSEGANISGSKLDINSVISSINNGTEVIKGTRIQLDEQGQSLQVAFNQLKSKVETIEQVSIDGDLSSVIEQVTSNTTNITTMQGQISSLISNTTITKANGEVVQLKDEYNSTKDTVNSHTQKIGSLETNVSKISTGQNKWLLEMYDKGDITDGTSPITVEHIIGKQLIKAVLVDDSATNNQSHFGDNYLGRATTYVYLDHDYDWETTATSDDGSTIYLNGNIIATLTSYDPNVVTLPFKQGWNKITWVYNEGTGGDGWDFNPRLTTIPQIKYMNAYPMTNVDEVGNILDGNIKTVSSKQASLEQNLDGFKQTVSDTYATKTSLNTVDGKFADYSTTSDMNSAINQKANEITSTVSETYATKASLNTVDNKFTDYSTTSDMNSAIDQKANEITSTVSQTYATKTSVTDLSNNLTNNYSTTTAMNSAIDQKANEITSTVSEMYVTKSDFNNLNVGGRNFVINSGFKDVVPNTQTIPHWGYWGNVLVFGGQGNPNYNAINTLYLQNHTTTGGGICQDISSDKIPKNTEITISYDMSREDSVIGSYAVLEFYDADFNRLDTIELGDAVGHVARTVTTSNSDYSIMRFAITHAGSNSEDGKYLVTIGNVKIEKGNKATDWSPAPEDIDNSITTVDDKFVNYTTTSQMNSAIDQKANEITSTVSEMYATKYALNTVDGKFANYSTTSDMNSAINQKANEITSSVSETYATKTTVNDLSNNLANNYSTTTAMNSAINQKANEITSTVSETYATKADFDNLEIGGTNLVLNSSFANGDNNWNVNGNPWPPTTAIDESTSPTGKALKVTINTTAGGYGIWQHVRPRKTGNYTLSFYAKADTDNYNINVGQEGSATKDISLTTNWIKYTHTYNKDNLNSNAIIFYARENASNGAFYIHSVKLEYGNKATDWTPAPEDIDASITAVDNKFVNYSTTQQMNSAIDQKANEINMNVSNTYATKSSVTDLNNNLSNNYSTTQQMNSAIDAKADSITQSVSNTYATRTELNNVDNKFANYSTTSDMNSAIDQKANEITSSVSNVYSTKQETNNSINNLQGQINDTNNNIANNYASKSELNQTTNSITAKFSESGGYNLLRNSGFKNGLNYWEINQYNNPQNGVCEALAFNTDWGFPDSDVNCCCIRISNQSGIEYGIRQTFKTTIGKKYTVSFYYASHRMSNAYMVIRKPDGNWLTSKTFNPSEKSGGHADVNNWGILTHTFTATDYTHSFEVNVNSAQDNGHLWIAKPMICEGELLCPYSPHPSEVYDGITRIDKDGIKVFHNTIDGENYTHMSPTGFYIKNRGEDIFKVDTAGLYLKGRMDITGGSVPSSLLSGQVSDNLIGEWIRNGATNGSNSATWLNNSAPGWNNATSIVEAGHTNWDNAKSTLDANAGKWNDTSIRVNNSSSAWDNAYNRVVDWAYDSVGGTTTINGGLIQAGTITAKHVYLGDLTNYCNLIDQTASLYGFTAEPDNWGTWFRLNNNQRDTCISGNGIDGYSCYKCNGGESFRIKYQMKSNVKSGDTYCKVSIGCYGMLGDGNPFHTLCDGGMSDANSTEQYINTTIKIPDNARTFGVFLQLNGWGNWSGTCRIKNVQVIKMSSGELIVDGAITADKIAADAITGKNITGGTINIGNGVFVVDANGQIRAKTIPNSRGQFLDMSSSTYKIYKNSGTLAMQIGFSDLVFEGGNVNYSTPCIFMGSDGFNALGSEKWDAHSGRYYSRYYVTDNNGPTGDGHDGQPTMHFEFNTQYTDTDTGYAIPSKFKFYADGHMRISPVRDLEIYSYSNNGEVDSKGNEYLLAKFYSSNSNLYSSALDIPAVINTRRDDGILIADRSHAADGVSYDGNTDIMAALNIVAWHGENGNDYRYVRPYLDGTHGLGSADRRWGKIYTSYGTVDTSDRRCKTNINYLSPSNTKAPNKCIVSKEDIWNFIKDIDYASYNFIDSETGNTEVDNQFGFILQDLIQSNPDISNNLLLDSSCKNDSDAKDSPLMGYNKGNYINILGCALQQALVRIEELENKIKEGL